MIGTVGRFAGKHLVPALKATIKSSDDSKLINDLIANFGLDAAFGVMQGVMTPGDLREKIIAGSSTALGGAVGGLGLSAALPAKLRNTVAVRMPTELVGGYGGDMVGQMAGDTLQRATSADGMSAYDRLAEKQRREVEQQTLAALGMGGYNLNDLVGMV